MAFGQEYVVSTRDVENFWVAFDSLNTSHDSIATIQMLYLDKGTPALKKFVRRYGLKAADYISIIKSYPLFWNSLRQATSTLNEIRSRVDSTFLKIKAVYPEFKQPSVYFVIGCLQSGGTTRGKSIVIGSEISVTNSSAVTHELPEWQKKVIGSGGDATSMIAHEAIHTQQKLFSPSFIWGYLWHRVLTMSLSEGAADFVSEIAIGDHTNEKRMQFGLQNEFAIWRKFKREMLNNNLSNWLYNGTESSTPDMGYFVGYMICKTYYQKYPNSQDAIENIMKMNYGMKFLKRSGYQSKFE